MGNLFGLSFLGKDENPLPHSKISKYYADQEIRIGTPESSDVSKGEVLKLPVVERRTGSVRDGRRGILKYRPPTDFK